MAEPRVRIGLIGCGGIARQYHLRALLADPRAELVAVADPSRQARAALPALAGVDVCDDAARLLAREELDAVVVCASTPVHAELAGAAGEAGLHLYLEKPVALELDRAVALEAALGARREVTAVGFNFRRSPSFAELRERLRAGEIGAVRRLRGWHCEAAEVTTMPAWKRTRAGGGGVLLDLASHQVDMARWLLGEEIAAVESVELASTRSEDDDARLMLRTASGVPVEIVVSYVQGRKHRWEAEGEEGVLRAERWPARVSRPRRAAPGGPSRLATRLRAVPIPRREPSFALALADFVRAAGGAWPADQLPTIADGRRSLEVVLAAERAASRRQ